MKIDPKLLAALEATNLPWVAEEGGKHYKIKLAGRLVGIYPRGKAGKLQSRSLLNTISQVRRAAQELKST